MLAGSYGEIEHKFEELSVADDPAGVTEPIGFIDNYADGIAEVAIVQGGWIITGIYYSHPTQPGFVHIDESTEPALFAFLSQKITEQREGSIDDDVNDWRDDVRDESFTAWRRAS